MSNQEETGVLKYGDIIKLNCDNQYLFGKGLTHSSLIWHPDPSQQDPSQQDQYLSAFRILPKSINLIQTQLLNSEASSNPKDSNINIESLRLEMMNNMHHYSKAIGSSVTVSSNVELQHLATGKYLGVQLESSSSSSNEHLKFKLKDNPDDTCLIRLEPVFNFQKERSKLMNGDKVYFEIWISKLTAPIYFFKYEEKTFASFENKSKVKLELTCSDSENEQSGIFSWNYVFIKDSENNMSLTVSDGDDIVFTNDIELHKCLWRIEKDSPCGIVPKGVYRIRHITKKMYLTLELKSMRNSSVFSNPSINRKAQSLLSFTLSDLNLVYSNWIIDPINKTDSKYIKSQYCTIQNQIEKKYLSMQYLQMEKCYPILESQKNDNIYFQVFKCNEEISTDVAYADEIISRLDKLYKPLQKEMYNQDSSKEIISIPLNKFFFVKKLDDSFLKSLEKCLKILENFILNKNFNISSESDMVGEICKSRQDILRKQLIFDKLFNILDVHNSPENKQSVKQIFSILVLLCKENTKNKSEVLNKSELFQKFIKWDPEISRNLISIIEDFREGHHKFSSSIQKLIKEHIDLIEGNESLSSQFKSLIKHKVNKIEEEQKLKYVDFLLKVSVCEGQGMSSNQDLIIKDLLNDPKFFKLPENNGFSFLLRIGSDQIEEKIEDLFKKDDENSYSYEKLKFMKLIELLVNLCEGRNYNCINMVTAWFPLPVLINYVNVKQGDVTNFDVDFKLQASFLSLVSKAYVDVAPRFINDIPDYVVDKKERNSIREVFNNQVLPENINENELSSGNYQFENSPVKQNETEKMIIDLKNYLISHFSRPNHSAQIYQLELLKLINLMSRFRMFNPTRSDDQAQLIKLLLKLIKGDFIFHINSKNSDPEVYSKEKKVEANFEFLRKQKAKKSTVLKYSTKIFNYLSSTQKNDSNSYDLNEDCIIEILQAISFYLNWRQDEILKNLFAENIAFQDVFALLEAIPQVIKKEGSISNYSIVSKKFLVKLLDLFIQTKRFEVKSQTLSIFIRSCYVLRETISNINKIEYLKDVIDIEVHNYLKKKKSYFIEIAEKSEIWVPNPSDPRYEEFLEILKNFSTLLNVNSSLIKEASFPGTEEISKIRQNIFFNLKIHVILMRFIIDCEYLIENDEKIKEILRLVYEILSKIIKDHKLHQEYFKKHLKLFLNYLQHDLGQIETVCEIYKNNYELCTSVDYSFIHLFIDCIFRHGRQARFLRIFEVIQIVDKEPILDIQLKVMNCLLDRNHYETLCYCENVKNNVEVEFRFEVINMNDQPIAYHAQLFRVMSKSTTGIMDVEINESKCKKILKLKTLFELLKRSEEDKKFTPMLIPLLELFYEVYLDSKQRLDKTIYYNELTDLVKRNGNNIFDVSPERISLIVKILKKYSEIYSLDLDIKDELSIICRDFLNQVINRQGRDENFLDVEMGENLNQLSRTFSLNYSYHLEMEAQNKPLSFKSDNLDELKGMLKGNKILKERKKSERYNIADIILKAKTEAQDLKSIISELLQIIKYYKTRKISKKTVLLSILILKTLVIHESKDESEENKKNKGIECIKELEGLNGLSLMLQILSERDTESIIFQKILVLLIKILKNGTTETQNLFYNFFINNQESEVFFKSLSNILLRFKPSSKEKSENSFKPICRSLELSKLLCENHNTQLQNYLRVQDKSLISFNFINSILILLENLIKSKEKTTFKAAGLCFDTLTEMCQGPCKENQRAVIDSNFVEITNELLGINEKTNDLQSYKSYQSLLDSTWTRGVLLEKEEITTLKHKALMTLHSLIEGNEDKYILSRLLRTISIETLRTNMVEGFKAISDKDYRKSGSFVKNKSNELGDSGNKEKKNEINVSLQVGILIYHLFRVFQDNPTRENKKMVKALLPEVKFDKGTFNYLDRDIYMTEENEESENNQSILPIRKKNQVVPEVYREGNSEKENKEVYEKAIKFYEESTGNIDVMLPGGILCKIYFWLDQEYKKLSEDMKYDFHYHADRSSNKNKLEYLLSRVADIKDHIEHEALVSKMISSYRIVKVMSQIFYWKILAFLSAIALFSLTLEYYSSEDSLNLTVSMLTANANIFQVFHALEIIHLISSILIVIFYYLKTVPVIFKKSKRSKYSLIKNHLLFRILYVYMNLETIYLSCYLAFSVLGCFYHVFFFAFHLLDFLYLFPILQSVIISVIQPWKSIVLLLVFIVIVMYIFSLFSYIYFSSYFIGNCESLLMCTFYSILEGIKNTGGVGYYTFLNNPYYGQLRFSMFLYDNINNIIIFIILWSILTGVIINAFAIIRGEKESNIKDQASKCFICGIDKDQIEEKTKKPFKFHRKYEHNEWYYVFFIIYVRKKKPQDYSGIESIIIKEIDKSSMNWVPQDDGFSLRNPDF